MKHYKGHCYMFHIPYEPSLIKDKASSFAMVSCPSKWFLRRPFIGYEKIAMFLSHSHITATTKILCT